MTEPANNYQTADQASIEGLEDLLEIVATDADNLTTNADIVVTNADTGKWVTAITAASSLNNSALCEVRQITI